MQSRIITNWKKLQENLLSNLVLEEKLQKLVTN